jgi:hypothetical protein
LVPTKEYLLNYLKKEDLANDLEHNNKAGE